ncbi:MAG TPA: serine/threonine-protein kinase, partial [Byssovorax sp.]
AGVHAFLGHRVAIKLLHRSMDEDPVVSRRFLSEARAAASIRHPNVVGVLDYGLLTDGRAFIVMDRIDGEPLEKRLERDVRLEATAALLLAREIAEALAASHAHGVVHLDLKPANVILLDGSTDGAPRIKLIDFGAAARAGRAEDVALLVGTPAYMSPEHARGEPPDPRSDVYSLGVVLFELLSGRRPFDFPDTWQTFRAHMFDPPPRVDTATTPLPEAVHALIARALKKKPDERHQTAEELIAEIDLALRTMSRSTWLRWLP